MNCIEDVVLKIDLNTARYGCRIGSYIKAERTNENGQSDQKRRFGVFEL